MYTNKTPSMSTFSNVNENVVVNFMISLKHDKFLLPGFFRQSGQFLMIRFMYYVSLLSKCYRGKL